MATAWGGAVAGAPTAGAVVPGVVLAVSEVSEVALIKVARSCSKLLEVA